MRAESTGYFESGNPRLGVLTDGWSGRPKDEVVFVPTRGIEKPLLLGDSIGGDKLTHVDLRNPSSSDGQDLLTRFYAARGRKPRVRELTRSSPSRISK